jgi:hypothetical protein
MHEVVVHTKIYMVWMTLKALIEWFWETAQNVFLKSVLWVKFCTTLNWSSVFIYEFLYPCLNVCTQVKKLKNDPMYFFTSTLNRFCLSQSKGDLCIVDIKFGDFSNSDNCSNRRKIAAPMSKAQRLVLLLKVNVQKVLAFFSSEATQQRGGIITRRASKLFVRLTLCSTDTLFDWHFVDWHFVRLTLCLTDTLFDWHFVWPTLCSTDTLFDRHFVRLTLCLTDTLFDLHFVWPTLC